MVESPSTKRDTEAKKRNERLRAERDVERREQQSKLSAARKAKTFIKSSSDGPRTAEVQPIPWPMPPRLYSKEAKEESSTEVCKNRDADREYLTPQSSFIPGDADSSSQVDRLPDSEQSREDSGKHSKESSVKRESFSSVGTGFSFALADSSDSASSESVSKVDIDADEFAHFLSEKRKSSQHAVDFMQLFAEEVQENGQEKEPTENTILSPAKTSPSSEFSDNSTTPKATRAPFRHRRSTKSGGNTVSLKEALNFSPDYKTIGKDRCPLFDEEQKRSREREKLSASKKETVSEGDENEHSAESSLRRPMASRQRTFLVLPRQRDEASSTDSKSEENSDTPTSAPTEKKNERAREEGQLSTVVVTTPPVKGVIMRAQTHVSHVAGIRRAETGRIMSKAELRAQKQIMIQESPNPKSLNPAGFPNEEDDMETVHPSTLYLETSSDSDKVVNSKKSATQEPPPKKQQPSGSPSAAKVDDGSFLSPGILSRKKKFGTEEYRVDSFQFSEHDGSSGLLNRFSSGFRKMQMAVAKKSASHEITQAAESAITVPGTIDEAACKICVVCRKQLESDVYVKDAGKKIKVESRKDGRSGYLRATILVRQMPGESPKCEVYIRQSRSDGMKTSLATLWNFYQRLEAGLKEMG